MSGESRMDGLEQPPIEGDYVDLTQLPGVLQQLTLSSKQAQSLQANSATQIAALKHEFDMSVRAGGNKNRELDKANIETGKRISDHDKQLAKLAERMKAADHMVDAVKESSRKVKAMELRVNQMDQTQHSHTNQLAVAAADHSMLARTRTDTDDVQHRMEAAEALSAELADKLAEAQASATAAHERLDVLKDELDREHDDRLRVESEHAQAADNIRSDLARLVSALGGRLQLAVEDFTCIQPAANEKGALDVTLARIRRLDEAQGRMVAEFQRVEDLETRTEAVLQDMRQAQAHIKTIHDTESEVQLRLSSLDKWKNKIETKMDHIDERTLSAEQAAIETQGLVANRSQQDSAVHTEASTTAQDGAVQAEGASSPSETTNAKTLSKPSARPVVRGLTKEEMNERMNEHGADLLAKLSSTQQDVLELRAQLEALEMRAAAFHHTVITDGTAVPEMESGKRQGEVRMETVGVRQVGLQVSGTGGEDLKDSQVTEPLSIRSDSELAVGTVDKGWTSAGEKTSGLNVHTGSGAMEFGPEAATATLEDKILPTKKGAASSIPERTERKPPERRKKEVAVSRQTLTNEEMVQQQGETFILMYNEIAALRKELRAIKSSSRPSMLAGTRNFSAWALRDPFRPLDANGKEWERANLVQEITVFPDGTDRDLQFGFMPVAAQNVMSDPDVEQFMRDAIYMLHREMSSLRKDVNKFKLEGDPAMLAAMHAGDEAKEALRMCNDIREEVDRVHMEATSSLENLKHMVHHNRHDTLERLKLAKEQQNVEKFEAIDLEFLRLHTDILNLNSSLQGAVQDHQEGLKPLQSRVEIVEDLSQKQREALLPLNKRVDRLDGILMSRVKEKQALEMEQRLKNQYAYSFDFSQHEVKKVADWQHLAPSASLQSSILNDFTPETRIFDVQRVEMHHRQAYSSGSAGPSMQRPASARVQQARPQSARMHRPAAGIAQCEDDRGAEQLKAMAKQVDYVTASVIPPDSGRAWTRSGRVMPPERREIKRAHVSPIVVGGGGTEGRTFKARPAPKATITPAEAAKLAVAEASVQGSLAAAATAADATDAAAAKHERLEKGLPPPNPPDTGSGVVSGTGTRGGAAGGLLMPKQRARTLPRAAEGTRMRESERGTETVHT